MLAGEGLCSGVLPQSGGAHRHAGAAHAAVGVEDGVRDRGGHPGAQDALAQGAGVGARRLGGDPGLPQVGVEEGGGQAEGGRDGQTRGGQLREAGALAAQFPRWPPVGPPAPRVTTQAACPAGSVTGPAGPSPAPAGVVVSLTCVSMAGVSPRRSGVRDALAGAREGVELLARDDPGGLDVVEPGLAELVGQCVGLRQRAAEVGVGEPEVERFQTDVPALAGGGEQQPAPGCQQVVGPAQGLDPLGLGEVVDVVVQGDQVELGLRVEGAQVGLPGLDPVGQPPLGHVRRGAVGHVLLEVDGERRQAGLSSAA